MICLVGESIERENCFLFSSFCNSSAFNSVSLQSSSPVNISLKPTRREIRAVLTFIRDSLKFRSRRNPLISRLSNSPGASRQCLDIRAEENSIPNWPRKTNPFESDTVEMGNALRVILSPVQFLQIISRAWIFLSVTRRSLSHQRNLARRRCDLARTFPKFRRARLLRGWFAIRLMSTQTLLLLHHRVSLAHNSRSSPCIFAPWSRDYARNERAKASKETRIYARAVTTTTTATTNNV